jgi:4-hydroxythreonine-4-phosphate dehydrogenase
VHETKTRIAITMGDPAGIGPEICLRALQEPEVLDSCVPVVFGDADVLTCVAQRLGRAAPQRIISAEQWSESWSAVDEPCVLDLNALGGRAVEPGLVDRFTGRAAYEYIEAAISAADFGQVDGITTGPVHKAAWHAAGVPFVGHTELLAIRTNAARVCMMLTSPAITCSLVTDHVGLREVPGLLSVERILDAIELTNEALVRMRGRPVKLAVCGLNPHAGEEGLFGSEESEYIVPAIEAARTKGIDVDGPLPADTAFLPSRRELTDGYICMYHDQGLIPLKALAFDVAVNVTLGLPIVRTSVDHGTALDIAWQDRADVTSLVQAVALAARLATLQKHPSTQVSKNPKTQVL